MATSTPIVDIHTHIYPPSYMELLKSRNEIPYVRKFDDSPTHRLVILPAEDTGSTTRGRPVGPEYYDIKEKIKFMDTHSITTSVISLANPWLDWLPPSSAASAAESINNEINSLCSQYPKRLYFFAALPLSGGQSVILSEISRLKSLSWVRGIILGTTGLGKGLDDPELLPVFKALAEEKFPIFLHPHYGLPGEVYGESAGDYGHVLPLALGFPMETTIAVTRMILSGVFDAVPELQMLLAHSGGTLPFLAGRIESCILHDAHLKNAGKLGGGRKSVWDVLKKNLWLDAVVYGEVGVNGAVAASGGERVMFGTDAPFFPPLEEEEEGKWLSVQMNVDAIGKACGAGSAEEKAVLGGNAVRLLNLELP